MSYVDANRILIDEEEYRLRKFVGLNERTCLNQQPCVALGQKVKQGDVMSLAKFDVEEPCSMASVLTTESVEALDLKPGDRVMLVVKAINVLPVKE